MRSILCVVAAAAALAPASAALAQAGHLYMFSQSTNRNVFELDMSTGLGSVVGTYSTNASSAAGLAYDCSSGTLYMASSADDDLYRVDPATWTATLVGPFSTDPDVLVHGLEWDSSTGTLYATSRGNLYTVDTTTGALTLVGASGLGTGGFLNLGYDPRTDTMYGTWTSTDTLHTIDRATGVASAPIGPLNGPTNPHGVAFNHDNGTMYLICSSTRTFFSIDLATGATTTIGTTGGLPTGSNWLGLVYISTTPGCWEEPDDCPADFNDLSGVTVQDIYDFLADWNSQIAGGPVILASADFNGAGGVTVQDIYDFLGAWNTGCP